MFHQKNCSQPKNWFIPEKFGNIIPFLWQIMILLSALMFPPNKKKSSSKTTKERSSLPGNRSLLAKMPHSCFFWGNNGSGWGSPWIIVRVTFWGEIVAQKGCNIITDDQRDGFGRNFLGSFRSLTQFPWWKNSGCMSKKRWVFSIKWSLWGLSTLTKTNGVHIRHHALGGRFWLVFEHILLAGERPR